MDMRAAMIYGPKDLRIDTVEAPEAGSDGVVVKIVNCGVCPSDVRNWTGAKKGVHYPMRTGHEWVGEIVEIGSNVEGFKVGDRVGAFVQRVCGMCRNCQKGLFNMCTTRFGPQGNELLPSIKGGGFAEYGWAHPAALKKIPEGLPYDEAAFAEPLACCYNGVDRTPIRSGDTVVIVGVGPIGQLLAQLARVKGGRVIAVDLDKGRLDMARQLGAEATVVASDMDVKDQILALTNGIGAEAVIVAVGSPRAEVSAFDYVAPGGCVNLFAGTYPSTTIAIDPNWIHYKQLWVTGSFHFTPGGYLTAMDLLGRHVVNVEPLISHHLPLSEMQKGFEMVANQAGMKIMVHMEEGQSAGNSL